jgi:hypothetical protein
VRILHLKNLEVVELVKVNKAIIKNVNIRNESLLINQTKLFYQRIKIKILFYR